jgi:hypothetical protein
VIYLGEIQIKLGVVPLHFESFPAQPLSSKIPLLSHSREHTYVGKIEWILRLSFKSAANVSECYALMSIVKVY